MFGIRTEPVYAGLVVGSGVGVDVILVMHLIARPGINLA